MLTSRAYTILSLLAGASVVSAHGYVYSWTIDGTERRGFNPDGQQGYKGAERPTDNYQGFKEGVKNGWGPALRKDGPTLACGGTQAGSGLEHWPVKAGSEIIIEWSDPKNGESVWPEGHLGPMIDYMAKCPGDSCDGVAADSLQWFKVKEETYENGQWACQKITAGQDWTTSVPSDIAPGAYLFRHEIISLHFEWSDTGIDADGLQNNGWQSYPYCFQAMVESSGSAVPTDTMTFPDGYNNENYEWYDYSIWDSRDPNDYVAPGPAVYTGGGPSGPAPSGNSSSPAGTSASSAPSASATIPSDDNSGSDEEEAPVPAPTDDEEVEEPAEPTGSDEEPVEPTAGEEEPSPSATAAPEETSSAGSEPSPSSSRRTRGSWRNWRNSRTSAAAAAEETEESSESDYKRRNVVNRYAPRRFNF